MPAADSISSRAPTARAARTVAFKRYFSLVKSRDSSSEPAAGPSSRPLRTVVERQIARRFEDALAARDGETGAPCIHELWMRGAHGRAIETGLERLRRATKGRVPEWLPTR